MPMTVALYKKLEEVEPQLRGVLFAILEEIEQQREETVTKVEFNELTEIVRDLAEAQKQTETKLSRLETAIGELTASVKDLVNEQARTRTDIKNLVNEQAKTRTELTGLTTTVGFVLEDRAYYSLPALLKRDFGLEVRGDLVRKYVRDKMGEQIEVNIIGEAARNGDQFVIVGESKSQLSKSKIEEFLRKKLKRLEGVFQGELFPIMITYMASQPEAVEFALQQGIKKVCYSYEFPP